MRPWKGNSINACLFSILSAMLYRFIKAYHVIYLDATLNNCNQIVTQVNSPPPVSARRTKNLFHNIT